MNVNKCFLAGNLTRDVSMSYLPSNMAIAEFSIAVNRKYKDKEEVSFFDVVAFSKTAETINQYFAKGKPIFIKGRIKQERFKGKDGNNRSKIKIIVDSFQFIGTQGQNQPPTPAPQPAQQPQAGNPANTPAANDNFYEGMPKSQFGNNGPVADTDEPLPF